MSKKATEQNPLSNATTFRDWDCALLWGLVTTLAQIAPKIYLSLSVVEVAEHTSSPETNPKTQTLKHAEVPKEKYSSRNSSGGAKKTINTSKIYKMNGTLPAMAVKVQLFWLVWGFFQVFSGSGK